MKEYTRKSKLTELKQYDHLAKENDYIELTDWHNGEGFDISINERQYSFSYGEFEAITALVHYKG